MTRPKRVTKRSACTKCMRQDTDQMVECCVCEQWQHYDCAGVTKEIESSLVSFTCERCVMERQAKQQEDQSRIEAHMTNTPSSVAPTSPGTLPYVSESNGAGAFNMNQTPTVTSFMGNVTSPNDTTTFAPPSSNNPAVSSSTPHTTANNFIPTSQFSKIQELENLRIRAAQMQEDLNNYQHQFANRSQNMNPMGVTSASTVVTSSAGLPVTTIYHENPAVNEQTVVTSSTGLPVTTIIHGNPTVTGPTIMTSSNDFPVTTYMNANPTLTAPTFVTPSTGFPVTTSMNENPITTAPIVTSPTSNITPGISDEYFNEAYASLLREIEKLKLKQNSIASNRFTFPQSHMNTNATVTLTHPIPGTSVFTTAATQQPYLPQGTTFMSTSVQQPVVQPSICPTLQNSQVPPMPQSAYQQIHNQGILPTTSSHMPFNAPPLVTNLNVTNPIASTMSSNPSMPTTVQTAGNVPTVNSQNALPISSSYSMPQMVPTPNMYQGATSSCTSSMAPNVNMPQTVPTQAGFSHVAYQNTPSIATHPNIPPTAQMPGGYQMMPNTNLSSMNSHPFMPSTVPTPGGYSMMPNPSATSMFQNPNISGYQMDATHGAPSMIPNYQMPYVAPNQYVPQTVPNQNVFPTNMMQNAQQPNGIPQPAYQNLHHSNASFMNNSFMSMNYPPLTADQLAARKTIKLDLPRFDGDPVKWAVFSSYYYHTTFYCGFRDFENLNRLVNALEGEARTHVESLLTNYQNVPLIMSRLHAKFGRPDLAVEQQLNAIRKLPPIDLSKPQTLNRFGDLVHNAVSNMVTTNQPHYLYNPELLKELVRRLPMTLKTSWAEASLSLPYPNLQDFETWLSPKVQAYDRVLDDATRTRVRINIHEETETPQEDIKVRKNCPLCNKNCKTVVECPLFQRATRNERWKMLRKLSLCKECLRPHQGYCRNPTRCNIDGCTYSHHPLLHNKKEENIASQSETSSSTNSDEEQHLTHQTPAKKTFFRVVPVTLSHGNNKVDTYAFLDEGSAISMLDAKVATKLQLKGQKAPLHLRWTADLDRVEDQSESVTVNISEVNKPEKQFTLKDVRTVTNLSLPRQTLPIKDLQERYPHLKDLPIHPYKDVQPMLLLGIDHYYVTTPLRRKEGCENEPIAVKSRIGWSVIGRICNNTTEEHRLNLHVCENEPKTLCITDHSNLDPPNNPKMKLSQTKCPKRKKKKHPALEENQDRQTQTMEPATCSRNLCAKRCENKKLQIPPKKRTRMEFRVFKQVQPEAQHKNKVNKKKMYSSSHKSPPDLKDKKGFMPRISSKTRGGECYKVTEFRQPYSGERNLETSTNVNKAACEFQRVLNHIVCKIKCKN